ncbi:MAG: VWA domain-containing protein [Candidatus Omnitrophica bacterium]|nr:VWA domain-containing protein [Candidatus Omnitrophota bacterium]
MQFAEIQNLNFLWFSIAIGLFLVWAFRRKKTIIKKFVSEELLLKIAANKNQRMEIFKGILLVLVFVFSVIALARPQWGFKWHEVKRQGLDIIIAIDTSKSMMTDDVKPNRLERAKLAVKDLIKKLQGDRIGLIAFAGSAFLTCPLTVDYSGFLISLDDLDLNTVSRGGTSLASAIHEAMKGYEKVPSQYKAVVIITDGENLQGDPIAAAKKAAQENIKIFCVGIGTPEGELIRIRNDQGDYEFLKDNDGNFVKSRLDEQMLKQIALLTGGAYVRSSGAEFGLDYIYEKRLSKMEKREIESKMKKQYTERFQIPLAIACLFLIMEAAISTRKKI